MMSHLHRETLKNQHQHTTTEVERNFQGTKIITKNVIMFLNNKHISTAFSATALTNNQEKLI